MANRIVSITTSLPIILTLASAPLHAHDPITTQVTWDREIVRLVTGRCVTCHRDGGVAFSLASYDDARPWAKAIKEETLARRMPPFGAVKGFADLRDDRSLTMEQLELIADWVEGGAPEGDPTWLPTDANSKPASSPWPLDTAKSIETAVNGATILQHALVVSGVKARDLAAGGSLRVFAQEPSGKVVPLIWLYQYNPKFDQAYYFRQQLALPAGTRILMPAGALSLLSPAGK